MRLPAQQPTAAPTAAPTGRITGRVIDVATGAGLSDAGVQVVGTTLGVMSGVDGRFTILRVPAGTVTLQVRRIGYQAKTITGLMLPAGGAIEQNVSMGVATVQLTTQTVTASAERGSVNDALMRQKKSANVLNEITSEQIARSPDNDAAAAVQRVSGVSVQDGKYVFVRGLGERYTTASLNGSRLPSPEPERKVVPLDLFPSGLLQSVTTIKTFTPDIQGDFSGAQVDIKTREFPTRRQVTYQFALGANGLATGRDVFSAPRAGGELFGMSPASRRQPGVLASTNFLGDVSQQRFNEITRAQRNVWTPNAGTGLPNSSMAVSAGGNSILGKSVGYIVSANYGLSQEIRANEEFAIGNAGPNNTVAPLARFRGETGRTSALWGGLANFSTMVGRRSRISFNNTVTRSADNEARQDRGFDENLADSVQRTTLRYIERGVVSSQLAGEHQLTPNQRSDWSLNFARTSRSEPDRSDVVYSRDPNGTFRLLGSLDGARRLYFDLGEDNAVAQANHQLWLGGVDRGVMIKFGGYFRATDRTADAPIFSFLTRAGDNITSGSPSQIFSSQQACDACNTINVQPVGQAGSYTATDRTSAGYLMSEFGVFGRSRLIVGARVEDARITVNTTTQGGFTNTARLSNTDVLPSVVLNTRLGERSNFRLAATQTLARPEYRELSPVTFRDVLGGVSLTGNDQLVRTLIQNYDARWEFFPTSGEVISL
nr:carboxypeptidase regulatory-like domain-containing protein [Gemmatimonadaceae bacterium]